MNPTERSRPDWDTYGMLMAHVARVRSPDPYTQVGAAAFRFDHATVSTGYNGARQGQEIDWSDRDGRRPFVRHAEHNCLALTKHGEAHYLYVTMLPCASCLEKIHDWGVKEIIYDQLYDRDHSTLTKAGQLGIVLRQLSLPKHYQEAVALLMQPPN